MGSGGGMFWTLSVDFLFLLFWIKQSETCHVFNSVSIVVHEWCFVICKSTFYRYWSWNFITSHWVVQETSKILEQYIYYLRARLLILQWLMKLQKFCFSVLQITSVLYVPLRCLWFASLIHRTMGLVTLHHYSTD
jgi:hypothetical protein